MANMHVFTGMDGAISVAVESGPEGEAAKAVDETYALAPIGRATGVTVKVVSDMRPFHEIGQRYATELRPGNVNVYGTIGRAHVKPGATVIDVGIHRVPDESAGAAPGATRLVGDVRAEELNGVAAALSPVPGGVGPLTVAALLSNTIDAAERAATAATVPGPSR